MKEILVKPVTGYEYIKEIDNLLIKKPFVLNLNSKFIEAVNSDELIEISKKSFNDFGIGLHMLSTKTSDDIAGIAGLVKNEQQDTPFLFFRFFSEAHYEQYAFEAANYFIKECRNINITNDLITHSDAQNGDAKEVIFNLGFKEVLQLNFNHVPQIFYHMLLN